MPPLSQIAAAKLIALRHAEYVEHQRDWRWLADSLEGGKRYQRADYTVDPIACHLDHTPTLAQRWPDIGPSDTGEGPSYGSIVDRNLIPHLSETGPGGKDLYTLRLARTPIPTLLDRAVRSHLERILSREVERKGPPNLKSWWEDVDGRGSSIDAWIADTAGPLFLALGQLDILVDAPLAPDGMPIETQADVIAARLDRAIVSVILPEHLPWWRLDPDGRHYVECVVFDRHGVGDSGPIYWHWTTIEVQAYDRKGQNLPALSREHGYGRVPIVRVFDRRLVRCRNVGRSRYYTIAEAQKAKYNLESERHLSNVQASHALLQGPEDYVKAGTAIPTGPGNILPKAKSHGNSGATYEGWEYVDPPTGAQASLRQHVIDISDDADRDAALSKPAGMTQGATVSQSGVSKIADQTDGNKLLADVAARLERLEMEAARLALAVLTNGRTTDGAGIEIRYPREFDLDSLADVGLALDTLQRTAATAGDLPETEGELLKRLATLALPGASDDTLRRVRAEIDAFVQRLASQPEARDVSSSSQVSDPTQDPQVNV